MSTRRHPHLLLGIVISLFAYLFLSGAAVFVRAFQAEEFPTIQIIFIQSVICFLCSLPFSLRGGWDSLKTNELPTHFMRDLSGIISYYCYFLAIRYLNLVDAATLNYTAPFFVPLVWWIWMRSKVERSAWWSIVIGFIGAAILLNPTSDLFQFGFVFGIFAGITSGIALVAIRILSIKNEPMPRTLFYYFSISSILTFPFAWAAWVPPQGSEWLLAIGIGVFTSIGQMLLTVSFRYGTAALLSPLCYAAIIYNGLGGYFVFGNALGWRSYVGTALIILGGTVSYVCKRKPHTFKETFEQPDKKKPLL